MILKRITAGSVSLSSLFVMNNKTENLGTHKNGGRDLRIIQLANALNLDVGFFGGEKGLAKAVCLKVCSG